MAGLYTDVSLDGKDSIRLLKFAQPQQHSVIELELITASLSTEPEYRALSYAWEAPFGNPSLDQDGYYGVQEHVIEVNGGSLHVTKNLLQALLVLRGNPRINSGHFWVDAISINQSDVDEKDEQIKIMAKIFRKASRVLVWLGEADSSTESAMALMEAICRLTPEQRYDLTPRTVTVDRMNSHIESRFRTVDGWRPLARFFCRRYFKRAWVVQEILSANSTPVVLCGEHKLDWSKLLTTSEYLATSPWGRLFRQLGFTGIEGGSEPHHADPAKLAATTRNKLDAHDNVIVYLSLIHI